MKSTSLGAVFVALTITWFIVPRAPAAAVADRDESLQSGGRQRTYHVHVPPGVQPGAPRPLVLVFHGRGGTGAVAAKVYGFSQLADARGFLVVYPDGIDRGWNDGRVPGAPSSTVDDVGFVSGLIDHLVTGFHADPRRVYVAGHSNGGIFAHRLACELSGKLAAIAPVAGTMAESEAQHCSPAEPVSVIEWHGTQDRFVPYGGGEVGSRAQRGRVLSVNETMALWARLNACPAALQQSSLAPVDPADITRVRRSAHGPCGQGSEVALYTIEGGGHGWPGSQGLRLLGPTTHQINATQTIWEFFERHARR